MAVTIRYCPVCKRKYASGHWQGQRDQHITQACDEHAAPADQQIINGPQEHEAPAPAMPPARGTKQQPPQHIFVPAPIIIPDADTSGVGFGFGVSFMRFIGVASIIALPLFFIRC